MNILLGDIHGNINPIFRYLHRGYLDDGVVYQIGDFGLFSLDETDDLSPDNLSDLDKKLVEHNTKLRVIRGNHDNPKFWCNLDERKLFNKTYQNIELLPDYHVETIGGKKVMFIGGAVSIDRRIRIEGVDWWKNEVVDTPIDGVGSLEPVDIVVAHSCPSFFNVNSSHDGIKYWTDNDDNLVQDLDDERAFLDDIFFQVKPKYWFSGHFHNTMKGDEYGCKYRCIQINELYCIDEYIPFKNLKRKKPIMAKTIEEIKIWVREQHDRMGQTRVNGDPYWTHTERVAGLVKTFHDNEDIIIAALAHDVLEDVDDLTEEEIEEVIGTAALEIVKHLTNVYTKEKYPSMNRAERKKNEAERLGKIPLSAKLVKLSDIIDNLSDVDTQKPKMATKYKKEKFDVLREMQKDDPSITESTALYNIALEATLTQ